MTSYLPIVKNNANGAILYVSLAPRTATGAWQANPTLASGDVKISLDGGAFANLNTLPAVTPAAGKAVKITLSQAETNADNIVIVFADAAGAEWCDLTISERTVAKQFDDLATAAAVTTAQADLDDIQSRLPAALVSGRIDASVGAVANDAITAAAIADNAIDAGAIAANAITAAKIADGAIDAATFAAGAIDAAAIAADAIGSSELAASAASEIGAAVWAVATRELTAGTNIVLAKGTGVTGFNDLSAAQVNAEADTALADYDAPTFAELDARTDAIDAALAAVAAKTDNLPSDPADASVIAGRFDTVDAAIAVVDGNVDAILADTGTDIPATLATIDGRIDTEIPAIQAALVTIAGYLDTEIAAIKSKTDNLPASPAATGDIPTANANADALLDRAAGVETGMTLRQALRIVLAACAGKASGLAGATATYRDTNDGKDRIVATVDSDGNRTAVLLDAT